MRIKRLAFRSEAEQERDEDGAAKDSKKDYRSYRLETWHVFAAFDQQSKLYSKRLCLTLRGGIVDWERAGRPFCADKISAIVQTSIAIVGSLSEIDCRAEPIPHFIRLNSALSRGRQQFRLKRFPSGRYAGFQLKGQAGKLLQRRISVMKELQRKLYIHNRWALLLIIQGMDSSGRR